VAAWRRRALESFPQLRRDLRRRDYTVYLLFFDLKPMMRAALDAGDTALLRRVFDFAEWCNRQTAKDLWNAAGVAFYEHVFDFRRRPQEVVPWLSPRIIDDCWQLWEPWLSRPEQEELRGMLDARRKTLTRGHVRPRPR
jgi:hypothetical protein